MDINKANCLDLFHWVAAASALVLMCVASKSCNFVEFNDASGTSDPGSIALQFGVWSYRSWNNQTLAAGGCRDYPDDAEPDLAWRAARDAVMLTIAFAAILVLFHLIAACCPSSVIYSRDWKYETAVLVILCICQGLTLLLLNSNACKDNVLVKELSDPESIASGIAFQDTCSISRGAKLSISACVLWFAAAVASFLSHKVAKDRRTEGVGYGVDQPLLS